MGIENKKSWLRVGPLFLGLILLLSGLEASELRVRIIVDDSSIKATPEITGKTLAKVAFNTVLESEEKADGWYKVTLESEGVRISGYIHEMLVEEATEEDIKQQAGIPGTRPKTIETDQSTTTGIVREIEIKIESSKAMIRQDKDLNDAIETLRPLIARTFRIPNNDIQRKLATELFLWLGLAYVGLGENIYAMQELRNMFEVDHGFALEVTRNIIDKKVVTLIGQAEKEYLGIVAEYSLEVITTPAEARILIDGEEKGLSPAVISLKVPIFLFEVEKYGYKKISEEMFLDQELLRKEIVLEQMGRDVKITSIPSGAALFLDEADTGNVTDCVLKNVPLGTHTFKVVKEDHVEWVSDVEVGEGSEVFPLDVLLTINNYVYITKWGGLKNRLFKNPLAVAVDGSDVAFIIDRSDLKVKRINAEGRSLGWRPSGKGFPGFKAPVGIAVDAQEQVYITDSKRHGIFKFDNRGQFIQGWGSEGSGDRQFRIPKSIAVNSQNEVFVVDSGNSCVKRFSDKGAFKQKIGKQGPSDGEFISPLALALNLNDELFVLDRTRLQKFSPEGTFVSTKRLAELGKPGIKIPQAIQIDKMGYIYLSDSGNHTVVKLNSAGSLIAQWGGYGARDGRLNYPAGLALNSNNDVLVVERDNNRVQIFGAPRQ